MYGNIGANPLRLRVPDAFEGMSVAGPTVAYEFHAKSPDGRMADASATSAAPAEVVLNVLSREGDGTAQMRRCKKYSGEGSRTVKNRTAGCCSKYYQPRAD